MSLNCVKNKQSVSMLSALNCINKTIMNILSAATNYTPAIIADVYVIKGRARQSYWPILRNQYGQVLPCWLTYCAMIWSLPDDADTQTQAYRDRGSEIHRQIDTQT